MKIIDTEIPDVKLIETAVFEDERGWFFESFNHKRLEEALGLDINFVQDNHSRSYQGVFRGLHYQLPPFHQGKLIRVYSGEIYDVVVDIRRSSDTFGALVANKLTAENKIQAWVPPGFAHGFLSLTKTAEVGYKVTNYFEPSHERCIRWDDPSLGLNFGEKLKFLSEKDKKASLLKDSDLFD
ncbi:dTDP-4-dehydrorhamnose 3,5-epimerase [Alphaproteobacteria bacterium]|nr:dTDP-4-dehydrorhamnose 3,5-epimerase [Alphaproteobacteria bacterium]